MRISHSWQSAKFSQGTDPFQVAQWMTKLAASSTVVERDVLDLRRARQLADTLPTRRPGADYGQSRMLRDNDSLPCGWSLIYFQPMCDIETLARDGSWTGYNAPAPYTRRMWASGAFHFPPSASRPANNGIAPSTASTMGRSVTRPTIGSSVLQRNKVGSVSMKKDMIFVEVEKEWFADVAGEPGGPYDDGAKLAGGNGGEKCILREMRCHVFRKDGRKSEDTSEAPTIAPDRRAFAPPASPDVTFDYTPTTPLLFRFSSLTFNAHRIHYDRDWAIEVEGQKGVVVHGPLTCLILLELVERGVQELNESLLAAGRSGQGVETLWDLESFTYRATMPMIVDEEIRLGVKWDEKDVGVGPDGRSRMSCIAWATQRGGLGMSASAILRRCTV